MLLTKNSVNLIFLYAQRTALMVYLIEFSPPRMRNRYHHHHQERKCERKVSRYQRGNQKS